MRRARRRRRRARPPGRTPTRGPTRRRGGRRAASPVSSRRLARSGAEPVDPHRGRRRAPHAGRRVADAAVLGAHDQVGAQREVGAAADAEAVDLGDHRPRRAPQPHVGADVAGHHPVVGDRVPRLPRLGLLHRLRAPPDVVAGAERAAGAAQPHDADLGVLLGPVERRFEVVDQLRDDRVEALRAAQREGRDRAVALVEHRAAHGRSIEWVQWRVPRSRRWWGPGCAATAAGRRSSRSRSTTRASTASTRSRASAPRSSTSSRRPSCSAWTACTTSRTSRSTTAASSRSRTAGSAWWRARRGWRPAP